MKFVSRYYGLRMGVRKEHGVDMSVRIEYELCLGRRIKNAHFHISRGSSRTVVIK